LIPFARFDSGDSALMEYILALNPTSSIIGLTVVLSLNFPMTFLAVESKYLEKLG
jgi:hypothetical protein